MANPVPPRPRILLPVLHASDQSAVSLQNAIIMGEYLEVFCDDANADVLYPMDWREEGPEYWPVFPFFGHPVKALFGGVCTWVNRAAPGADTSGVMPRPPPAVSPRAGKVTSHLAESSAGDRRLPMRGLANRASRRQASLARSEGLQPLGTRSRLSAGGPGCSSGPLARLGGPVQAAAPYPADARSSRWAIRRVCFGLTGE